MTFFLLLWRIMRKLHYDWFHSWALTIFAVQIISIFYSDDPSALVSRKNSYLLFNYLWLKLWYDIRDRLVWTLGKNYLFGVSACLLLSPDMMQYFCLRSKLYWGNTQDSAYKPKLSLYVHWRNRILVQSGCRSPKEDKGRLEVAGELKFIKYSSDTETSNWHHTWLDSRSLRSLMFIMLSMGMLSWFHNQIPGRYKNLNRS